MKPWKYLTGQFAEHVGLRPYPIYRARSGGMVILPHDGTLPAPEPSIDAAVDFEGHTYLQDYPGWTRP